MNSSPLEFVVLFDVGSITSNVLLLVQFLSTVKFQKITNLVFIKKQNKAFHPNAKRENLNMGKKIFCFKRTSLDKKQTIYNFTNLSSKYQKLDLDKKYKNLLDKSKITHKFKLRPYETLWLTNNK